MRKRVITLADSSATLNKNQSGALIVLNRAAGVAITLPSASRGIYYDFVVKTSVTSNVYSITTQTADKIRGTLVNAKDNTASKAFVATSSDIYSSNGGTTGGLIGTCFRMVADGAGVWTIEGVNAASGSEATPFA